MTHHKKNTPAKRVERVDSSPEGSKKRGRSPSDNDESDGRGRKERRGNKNKLADTTQKTASQKRKAAAQR